MNRKTWIALFVVLGLVALGGICHAAAFDAFLPSGAKAKGNIVGNKLMLQGANGKWSPAPDGVYKMGNGKSFVVQGGIVSNPGGPAATRGGMAMEDKKTKEKVVKEKGGKKDEMMTPGLGGPAATRGGIMMDKDKPKQPDRPKPDKPDKKGQMLADPATPGQGPAKALPMPQGIQGPAGATPMPQGTQGSKPPMGSPRDPMGPDGGSRPGGGPPPPR